MMDFHASSLPRLNAVRAFEAAARHLSFTRAADELCVTPSAVGQSVRALERWLGVPLFARDRRSSPDFGRS
jgi:LysR family transcriptional regulator, glycine cleavage system transcriptional activator